MLWRRILVVAALLAAAAVGLFSGVARTAAAAPSSDHLAQVVFGPPQEGNKLILGERSIAGPAVWSSGGVAPLFVLAWTGTDAAHHLNVMTSRDGFHYGAKRILSETSPYRPAVAFDGSGRAGFVVVAWTGTDAAHTLNVEYLNADTLTLARKVTLWGYTSFAAPAVAVIGDQAVALAWTDKAQNLSVLRLSPTNQVLDSVKLFASGGAPNLTYNAPAGQFLLTWVEPARNFSALFFSTSSDALHWTAARTVQEFSDHASSMVHINAVNMPAYWLAWTGTGGDTAHHLNVQYTESFPNWANVNSKTTFRETGLGGPALGYVGVARQVLVAWTGTDAAHHLNVAVVFVRS